MENFKISSATALVNSIYAHYQNYAEAQELSLLRNPALAQSAKHLMHVFNMRLSPEVKRGVLAHAQVIEVRQRLPQLYARSHQETEKDQARALIAQHGKGKQAEITSFISNYTSPGFRLMLQGHVDRWQRYGILRAGDERPIIMVGGGPLPQSQLLLNHLTGRTVITVDRDPEVAEYAGQVAEVFGKSSKLPVHVADGGNYDYKEAGIVVVAAMISGGEAVAGRVLATEPAAHLTFRTPRGLRVLASEPFNHAALLSAGWSLLDVWSPRGARYLRAVTFAPIPTVTP